MGIEGNTTAALWVRTFLQRLEGDGVVRVRFTHCLRLWFSGSLRRFWWQSRLSPIPEELQIFRDDLETAALFSGLFVYPAIHLDAPLDENRVAFVQVLSGHLGLASPQRYINEGCLLFFHAFVIGPCTVHGQPEIRDGSAAGGGPKFGIASAISQ